MREGAELARPLEHVDERASKREPGMQRRLSMGSNGLASGGDASATQINGMYAVATGQRDDSVHSRR